MPNGWVGWRAAARPEDRQWQGCAHARTRFAGLVLCAEHNPAPEPLTDEASKVGALPQTPPGAEPLDLNTLMHVFDEVLSGA